jgi:hypothetical protein
MTDPIVSRMQMRSFYDDYPAVQKYLAEQLKKEQLAIFLGSGVSKAFGLPLWDDLLDTAFARKSATRPDKLSNEDAAEYLLLDIFKEDQEGFHKALREALYEHVNISGIRDQLRHSPMLQALASLFIRSNRGSVRNVVTFNFDDLLESYLTDGGYFVQQVLTAPPWTENSDVRVFHPHGILPIDDTRPFTDVVIAQIHFDRMVGNKNNAWRTAMLSILSSHTCMFLGLSGADASLTSLLAETKDIHPATARKDLFWGFRFSDNDNDPRRSKWEHRGVAQITMQYDELPEWLRAVARLARS